MDDGRAGGSVEHDELEQVPGSARSEDEEALGVFGDLLDNSSVRQCVQNVVGSNPMAMGRRENVHTPESYYETPFGPRIEGKRRGRALYERSDTGRICADSSPNQVDG